MGSRGDGAGDADVGQRGQVVQCQSPVVEVARQAVVPDPAFDDDRYGVPIGVHDDVDHTVQSVHGDQRASRVCDVAEAVPRTERVHSLAA
jgi:hypothetical protein